MVDHKVTNPENTLKSWSLEEFNQLTQLTDTDKSEPRKELEGLRTLTVYWENFCTRENVLLANLMGYKLSQLKGHLPQHLIDQSLKELEERNQQMVTRHYLKEDVINQNNQSPYILGTDEDYRRWYNEKEETFVNMSAWFAKSGIQRNLDTKVDNTGHYVKYAIDFVVFLTFVQRKKLDVADNQDYLTNFVQPAVDAIENYRNAEGEASKISAYKAISDPLQKLTSEMYRRAVMVFPNVLQPKGSDEFSPKGPKINL